ncbi:MAG TPA: transposase [Ktedonobacteraceae bacterium]|nr:transposase [Ktedonobacteraceae bacterium]
MASATKTIRQSLIYRPTQDTWFAATKSLFNQVAAFYFDVIAAHPGILDVDSRAARAALERLTHATKDNPHPVIPLSGAVTTNIPKLFRRAAIHAALGSAHSFYTHLEKWRKHKEKALTKGKKFTIRPPVPPRSWNKSPVFYAGQWKGYTVTSIMLKLWTGSSWAWVKCGLQGRTLPDGWEMESPMLVENVGRWSLHIPVTKKFTAPAKVVQQLGTNTATRLCAVDLNISEHLAVCTIQTVEGTVVATRFIRGGRQLHGLRKRQLGRVARNRRKTGIIAEGERDNAHLWAKIRALNEDSAQQVSARIVQFAKEHQASILVFEHLGNFKPEKGKYSKRSNEKRSYWLRGKIFQYSKYKAWNDGIITCRVSPRNTSRQCARCGGLVARYDAGQPAEGYTPGAPLVYCSHCQMRGNADRNASIVIGQRLLARYHQQTSFQEKPPTPLLRVERPAKAGGVRRSQDVKGHGRPSITRVRHGRANAQGTAHDMLSGMVDDVSGIPHQLRLFNES